MNNSLNDVVIVGGYRTPFSKYGGALKEWSSGNLGAYLLPRALKKLGIEPERIDFLVCASSLQAEVSTQGNTMARQVIIKSGLPLSIPSVTMDQASCSGLSAVVLGKQIINAGDADVVVVLGIEAMSNAPFILPPSLRWGNVRREFSARDPIFPIRSDARPQGAVAEVDDEAAIFGVTREDMDLWAYESQMRFEAATQNGIIAEELIPVELADGSSFCKDEAPKPWTTMEKLRALKTVFGSTTITAGNSPGLETGAALVVLMRRGTAETMNIKPQATIRGTVSVAGDIECPLSQGARATKKLLESRNIKLEEIDVVEIEEDFAAVVPITANYLKTELGADPTEFMKKSNPNGGAVAVGHPIATGGTRILMSLTNELVRRQSQWGLAMISGGLSQGVAVLVERE